MAEGMDEFFGRTGDGDSATAFECVIVSEGINDPADRVDAKETAADGNGFLHINCRWSPRVEPNGATVALRYPDRDDKALVIISDGDEPWIVDWTPYG